MQYRHEETYLDLVVIGLKHCGAQGAKGGAHGVSVAGLDALSRGRAGDPVKLHGQRAKNERDGLNVVANRTLQLAESEPDGLAVVCPAVREINAEKGAPSFVINEMDHLRSLADL
jgi:hypothetical protein